MLLRNAISAWRLNSRVLSALVSSNRSRTCLKDSLGPSSAGDHIDAHVSKGNGTNLAAPSASGVDFLYQAIGLTFDRELVSRLAHLWGMAPEHLCSTAGTLASLLEPCGRDTTPHALWVLVRCPALRYWSEQQMRSSFRQLQQLTRDAQLTNHDLTRAVYQHPWMLNAAAAMGVVRRTPAAVAPMSTLAREACTSPGPVTQQPPHQQQHPLPSLTAHRWIATLLAQAQAYSARVSGSEAPPYVSPALAKAAVEAYIAVNGALCSSEQLRWFSVMLMSRWQR